MFNLGTAWVKFIKLFTHEAKILLQIFSLFKVVQTSINVSVRIRTVVFICHQSYHSTYYLAK